MLLAVHLSAIKFSYLWIYEMHTLALNCRDGQVRQLIWELALYVAGVVDGSHIPIVASRLHTPDYYNQEGLHSILLQSVLSSKCWFSNFDIGWAESMHNAILWARTDIGQYCEAARLSPYVLVGDAAYSCRSWMLAPYNGHKDGFSWEKYHWNYVQSSTRMCIKRTFRMLKERWRILLKRVDVNLRNVHDLVSTCLELHNMYIIF